MPLSAFRDKRCRSDSSNVRSSAEPSYVWGMRDKNWSRHNYVCYLGLLIVWSIHVFIATHLSPVLGWSNSARVEAEIRKVIWSRVQVTLPLSNTKYLSKESRQHNEAGS